MDIERRIEVEINKPGQVLRLESTETFIGLFSPLFEMHKGELLLRIGRSDRGSLSGGPRDERRSTAGWVTETHYWLAVIGEGRIERSGSAILFPCGPAFAVSGKGKFANELPAVQFGDEEAFAMSERLTLAGHAAFREVPKCELLIGDAAVSSALQHFAGHDELVAILRAARLLNHPLVGRVVLESAIQSAAACHISWLYELATGMFGKGDDREAARRLAQLAELGIGKEQAIEKVADILRERTKERLASF